MRKTIVMMTAFACFAFPAQKAHSLVVSDPGAYQRFAQQIKNLKNQLDALKENIDQVKSVRDNLEGNLNIGSDMVGDIQDLKSDTEDITSVIHSIPNILDRGEFNMSSTSDVRDFLDRIYRDDNLTVAGRNAEEKQKFQQRAIKAALENSQSTISSMGENMNEVRSLASEIDQTENQKEAQDLTNRLLAELLKMQHKTVLILAQQTRAEQLASYSGVSSQQEKVEGDKAPVEDNRSPLHKARDEGGMDKTLDRMRDHDGDKDCGFLVGNPENCN